MATTHATQLGDRFFDAQLEARGWSLFSKGASNGEPQSLFQKAGSDGFYWEVGVTVTKTSASTVYWTFRIYQNSGRSKRRRPAPGRPARFLVTDAHSAKFSG